MQLFRGYNQIFTLNGVDRYEIWRGYFDSRFVSDLTIVVHMDVQIWKFKTYWCCPCHSFGISISKRTSITRKEKLQSIQEVHKRQVFMEELLRCCHLIQSIGLSTRT